MDIAKEYRKITGDEPPDNIEELARNAKADLEDPKQREHWCWYVLRMTYPLDVEVLKD